MILPAARRRIAVVAAVLQQADGRFLLAQRPQGKVYAGYWEFPGGKVEPGETPLQALARELHEELGIQVTTAHPWLIREFDYEHADVKLHFREMAEPTGAWAHVLDTEIRPQHEAMLRVLTRALGLRRSDLDVHRLAIAIAGLAVHVFVFHEGVKTLSPALLATPRAIDTMVERLAGYALSMVEGERLRRARGTPA
jgi:mutator protein MutT